MDSPTSTNDAGPLPQPPFLTRLFKWPLKVLVFCFVCWHLFALVVRNPLDLWSKEIQDWAKQDKELWERCEPAYTCIDNWTKFYNRLTGCEQGWTMFTPPLWRTAPFLTVRIEFADGTDAELPSLNAIDPQSYLRLGGARLRKLETCLYQHSPDDLPGYEDLPVYAAYVRWSLRRWQEQAPGDRRHPVRVHLFKSFLKFPQPDEDPHHITEAEPELVGTFDPQGKLLP